MPRIVIAYCNLEFQAITEETPKPSYVFNLGKNMIKKSYSTNSLSEDPTTASLELVCPNHLVSCEYNPKENSLLAGGCYNGQVCYWDDRSVSHSLHHLTTINCKNWRQACGGDPSLSRTPGASFQDNVDLKQDWV